ncbi:MAG: AMP-binding protein [Alphaproteobacteria bacterium]|nr:AMP-binding protein [Alphaproteobacteria bacterium]
MDSMIAATSAGTIPAALVEQSVWRALQEPFARFADRVAIADQTGNVTFRDLGTRVEQVAAIIQASVSGEKCAVALLLTQGVPFIAALLATLKTGHYYIPLNPANHVEANQQILLDAEAGLLLTDSNYAEVAKCIGGTLCHVEDIDRAEGTTPDTADSPEICGGDLAGLFYTSGTTGKPKGVMQTQRNFLQLARSFINATGIGPDDRLLLGYHGSTYASVMNIFSGLLTGATLCPWDVSQNGAAPMADWLQSQRISVLYIFRSAFSQCMSAVQPDVRFPRVRALMLSSEPVYDTDVTIWRERFPTTSIFINHIGSTEAGSYRRYPIDRTATVEPGVLPLGYPVEDKDVLLCDEHGAQVRPGEIGEIIVRSRYIGLGYWKQPALSESVFSAPHGPDGARLFRTGDLGRMDADGCLYSLGRKDNQVKFRGRRVEVAKVEATLAGLEHVDQAAVAARTGGGGQTQLVAFFVSSEDTLSANRLRRQLADVLPHAEVPVVFVRLQALPRLPNGKIDRKALAAHEIVPEATPDVGPHDTVEKRLAEVLRRVLQVEKLGIDDDIFEHGADSLTAVEISAAIDQEFGVDVPMEVLWSGAHSVGALARIIRRADAYSEPCRHPPSTPAHKNARTPGYVNRRRLLGREDIAILTLLPAAILVAKLVPESRWRQIADLYGLFLTLLRPWRHRTLSQQIASQFDGYARQADGRAVLHSIRSGSFELCLRKLTSPAEWQTPLELLGQQHIESGLNRGRGVILWLSPQNFTGIVGSEALCRAGYTVHILSRLEHGFSPTVFGQHFLNRLANIGDDSGHVSRVIMTDDGQAAIQTLRRVLRENGVVAIVAAALTDQPFRRRFLDGEIELAGGPPRMALATGAALLPVFAHRHADGYRVLVSPALKSDVAVKDAAIKSMLDQFINQLEHFVRQYPAESWHLVPRP